MEVRCAARDLYSFQFVLIIISTILLEVSSATDTLVPSQALSVGQTLVSSNNMFELGFFSPRNSSKLYIGIWFKDIANPPKAVWVANRELPLLASDTASSLTIGNDGNLKILNGKKNTVWSTNISSPSVANYTYAMLSNKGEFTLKNNVSGLTLWDSFNYLCDTFIAGMKVETNTRTGENLSLTSWKTESDPSPGIYEMGFTTERPPQNVIWKNSELHWRSGPWNGWTFIGFRTMDGGYSNGLTITQDNQQGLVYATFNPPSTSQIMIEFLTPDGNIRVTRWAIGKAEDAVSRLAIEIFCDTYGACGAFGFCDRSKVTCKCLKGFVPKSTDEWKKGIWSGGCVRRTELLCRKNASYLSDDKEKNDGFAKLSMMKVPDHHSYMFNSDASGCRQQCLRNCSCIAYAFVDGIGCLVWDGELIDMLKFSAAGVDLFLRLAYSELGDDNKGIKLIIVLTTVLGAMLLITSIYILYRCQRARRRNPLKKADLALRKATQMELSDLPMFDFTTLVAATNDFSETNKLGTGGFGPVYKGKLADGQEIAVKRLSSHSKQGAVEFKNEILLISKLQHRNLVKLLGYCIEGDEKLLIYEYLKNNSLDTLLFGKKNEVHLDWDKRFNIIEGIARGILYLHRDSTLRVIHRDLKASNILLDDNLNSKISDFGLARAFEITRELANTHRVVGTYGYISPEYALGGMFSEKSDVFSFGVLLLEIISGMKNTSTHYEETYLNLIGYAWHLWIEGRGLDLMDKEISNSCSEADFMKCMQIGLLCVQDHATERPTMPLVVLLLTCDKDIPQPKQPTFYHGLLNSEIDQSISKNEVSVSIVGR